MKKIKNNIIRADQLVNYIKNDIDKYGKDMFYSEKDLKKTAEVWLSRQVPNITSFANKYLNKIEEKQNNDNLENELKLYRKEKSKKMNVPAYYIFTDDEMNSLIISKPKTIEELKSSNILSSIKIKCHGEEIIQIFKKY